MERISELMDGELETRETQRQLARMRQDRDLADCWSTFHLIGDVLRGERRLSRELASQVAAKLAGEPTILAPRKYPIKRIATYAASAAASFSAVALVAWIAFFNNPLAPQTPTEVAKAPPLPPPAVVVPAAQLASVPSEGQMNEYLIAHQEFSPSTAIQGLAPYIRGVSGTQQVRRR